MFAQLVQMRRSSHFAPCGRTYQARVAWKTVLTLPSRASQLPRSNYHRNPTIWSNALTTADNRCIANAFRRLWIPPSYRTSAFSRAGEKPLEANASSMASPVHFLRTRIPGDGKPPGIPSVPPCWQRGSESGAQGMYATSRRHFGVALRDLYPGKQDDCRVSCG